MSDPGKGTSYHHPLLSIALGRSLEKMIVPGIFPCPTTALALVLLTTSLPRVDKVLYILLLFWAIRFAPFIQIPKYGVYEDTIMFTVGIYSLVMLVRNWRVRSIPAISGAGAAARWAESAEGSGIKSS